jgi:hypothetical protein
MSVPARCCGSYYFPSVCIYYQHVVCILDRLAKMFADQNTGILVTRSHRVLEYGLRVTVVVDFWHPCWRMALARSKNLFILGNGCSL